MENKPKNHQTFDSVKRICLSPNRIPFYSILALLFIILNILSVPTLFSSGNDLFDANDTPILLSVFTLIGFLILISIVTPFWLQKKNTEAIDEDEPQPSAQLKILSLWVPFCFYITAQMMVFGICEELSPEFNIPFIFILLACVALCILIFVWIIICACLYFVARSMRWYFVGVLSLHFAPIIISWGCYEIYNVSPLVPYKDWNPLNFNLFVASVALFGYPIVLLLVLGMIIGIFLFMWRREKDHPTTDLTVLSIAYKIIVIFLISLSGAFLLSSNFIGKNQISLTYIFCFLVVALSVAILLAFFTFHRNRLFLRTGITVFAVLVSSALILGVIPARVQKEAYILPDKEEIKSVKLFLGSMEDFEVDAHFEDCIDLHGVLLELFEEGYLPDETEHPYKEPECIADLWEDANFRYKLKDGKSLYREYRDLKDPAFDDFYIRLMKSDMYAYSLQKTQMHNPKMQIFGKWCELPESCVEELLKTYCNELKKADKSAFYEEYGTIRLSGVYDFQDRFIYIPLSFMDTRNLATQYLNMYRE